MYQYWQRSLMSFNITRPQFIKCTAETVSYPCINIQKTLWGRVTHIYIGNLTIIGSDNGLWPCRCQAIIWTKTGILLIGPSGTKFNEILFKIHTFSFKKMHLKMSSGKQRPFCLSLILVLLVCNPVSSLLLSVSCVHKGWASNSSICSRLMVGSELIG